MIIRLFRTVEKFLKSLPIIRSIPGFSSLPDKITPDNLRFYKLSNLVQTFGMFIHFFWIFLFLWLEVYPMAYLNILSFSIYVFNIIINRRGYHFTSSAIMVIEIILHQLVAVRYFGWDAGFQYYVVVSAIFPFLMPHGKWALKSIVAIGCVVAFILMDYFYKSATPWEIIPPGVLGFFRISNISLAFISLVLSGAYFTIAVHETETKLAEKSKELVASQKKATLGEIATEMAHEIQNPLNFVNNFSEINEELLQELKEELAKPGNEELTASLVDDILRNSERIQANGKRISAIVDTLQQRANSL